MEGHTGWQTLASAVDSGGQRLAQGEGQDAAVDSRGTAPALYPQAKVDPAAALGTV